MNLMCRVNRGAADDIGQWYAHRQELRHHVIHTQDCVVAGMQIRGHGVGHEVLFCCGHGIAKPEAASTMADVENDSPLARFRHDWVDLAVGKDNGKLLSENMSVNVARPHLLENQVGVRSIWAGPEIKH